jgi:hypothetical protein
MAKTTTEAQLRIAMLQALANSASGFMTVSDLIAEMEDKFKPEGKDATILANRSDTHFSQKVRNVVSHRSTSTSIIKRGFVIYHKQREGLELTEAGAAYLKLNELV